MSDPIEHRVTRLEDGVDRLSDNLSQHSTKIDQKLDGIATLLTSLVRIEERQGIVNARLTEGAETMRGHEVRIHNIEVKMPGLLEKSAWFIAGVLGILSMLGVLVFNKVVA
jgi:Mg2+ and Co2+ transporter CorA